ncbi:hypothetical protein [Geodermatophilus sp. CPCC 206100]|uniref:hypothetical protein n=1 Tax=Geodermatophilus sp. CPCC 206100 TaxID=3020054 RepID=UPI003B00FB92
MSEYAISLEQFERLVRVPEDARTEQVPAREPVGAAPVPWLASGGGGAPAEDCDGE